MDLHEEEVLIHSANRKEAFGALSKAYLNDLYRYSYSVVGDKDKCEDVLQESLLRAYTKFDQYEFKGYSIKVWFMSFVRNVAYESIKKNYNTYADTYNLEDQNDIFEAVHKKDLLIDPAEEKEIQDAVFALEVELREVVSLKVWSEFTFDEIAALLNTNENTVKSRYYLAMKKLKEALTNKGYDYDNALLPGLIFNVSKGITIRDSAIDFNFLEGQLDKFSYKNLMNNLTFVQKTGLILIVVSSVVLGGAIGFVSQKLPLFNDDQNSEVEDLNETKKSGSEENIVDGERDSQQSGVDEGTDNEVISQPENSESDLEVLPEEVVETLCATPGINRFESIELGIGFCYPDGYSVSEGRSQDSNGVERLSLSVRSDESRSYVSFREFEVVVDPFSRQAAQPTSEFESILINGEDYSFVKLQSGDASASAASIYTVYFEERYNISVGLVSDWDQENRVDVPPTAEQIEILRDITSSFYEL